MIKVLKDNTKTELYTICASCGSELSYAFKDVRDDARDDFMEEIEELIEKAPDEQTRKKFERFVSEMR